MEQKKTNIGKILQLFYMIGYAIYLIIYSVILDIKNKIQLYLLKREIKSLNKPFIKLLNNMNNSIMIIHPYWLHGTWVFDDKSTGLVAEPFVSGIPEIIMALLIKESINPINAQNGFTAIFSATPFPEYTGVLNHIESDEYGVGNWYQYEDMKGWLCPALMLYFSEAPKQIYVKVTL